MQRITALEVAKDFLQQGIEKLTDELNELGSDRDRGRRPRKINITPEDRARRAADLIKARAELEKKRKAEKAAKENVDEEERAS
jgi:hypothetical protein